MNLTDRFIEGLKKYNLTPDDIANNNWRYCGGNAGSHLNYFNLVKDSDSLQMPPEADKCICGHRIQDNCYITDGSEIMVLGNCCIKKFVSKSTRTCSECGEPHKNRIVNRCNDCRIGICDGCDREIDDRYKTCYRCKFG
jgi:hypothetical protein